MRTITTSNTLGHKVTVSLPEFMENWEGITDMNNIKNLCFRANQMGDVYERLNEIEQQLIEIREQLVLDAFNAIYKDQNKLD